MSEHSAEIDATCRCQTPAEGWPGDEWTCPACGLEWWADSLDDGDLFIEWVRADSGEDTRVIPPERTD